MKEFFVIQDVKTKEYYWEYRIDEGYSANISDAKKFSSKQEIQDYFTLDYARHNFLDRILEIKLYFTIEDEQQK